MTIAEQIYDLVKSLPPDQASEILTFAELVHSRHLNANHSLGDTSSGFWSDLVYSLAGTWKEDFPTLEEIRAEAGQDIPRDSL